MITVTITIRNFIHVELSEDSARAALSEPAPLLAQIRAALAPLGAERANGRHQLKLSAPVPKVRRSGRLRSSGKVPCPHCGKELRPSSLPYHLRKKHSAQASAAAATA